LRGKESRASEARDFFSRKHLGRLERLKSFRGKESDATNGLRRLPREGSHDLGGACGFLRKEMTAADPYQASRGRFCPAMTCATRYGFFAGVAGAGAGSAGLALPWMASRGWGGVEVKVAAAEPASSRIWAAMEQSWAAPVWAPVA
jgi:hypothetical protein